MTISAVLAAGRTPRELEASISKKYGEEDFYLEKDREYRAERNLFTEFSAEEREKLFGRAPSNVWEGFMSWGSGFFDEKAEPAMWRALNEAVAVWASSRHT